MELIKLKQKKTKAMYTIIEKESGKVIIDNADETAIELFFAIEDIALYQVIDLGL